MMHIINKLLSRSKVCNGKNLNTGTKKIQTLTIHNLSSTLMQQTSRFYKQITFHRFNNVYMANRI